jgi:predicted nucleotidyltransferase
MICPAYGVKKLELFGSYARRAATAASDINLIATFVENPGLAVILFQRELETRLGKSVDLLEAGTIGEMRNPFRKASIEADRTTIYEA